MKETCNSSRRRTAWVVGTIALVASCLAFTLSEDKANSKPPSVRLIVDESPISRDGKFTTSFSPVVKKVAPSVVKVFTSLKVKDAPNAMIPDDPWLRRFFGEEPGERGRGPRLPKQHGQGSGVIVTKDGYILTNSHVVENADEVKVALTPDGREYTAKVIGSDPKTDIAVLKIEASDLPFLPLANSDQIEVGDIVLAVGNPFGIGQTVTMGMVSAIGRGNVGLDYEDFIQTDAAINPGNSGGALVDTAGRLVGINTAILSRSGGNQGIGFAVPANLARYVTDSLVSHGRVIRGFLGVMIQDVTPNLAKEFDLKDAAGALIAEVTPKSPAEKAGLKSGDVVLNLDGKPVRDSRQLKLRVAQIAPGKKVSMEILRDGSRKNVELTLQEFPQDEKLAKAEETESSASDALKGVEVADLDSAARGPLKLPRGMQGALVTNVAEDSAAFEAGLRRGDVIQEINRKPVKTAEDAVAMTEKMKDKTILLKIWSRGGTRFLVVDESKMS